MNGQVEVTVTQSDLVHTLPGIWEAPALRRLLALTEMDGFDESDGQELLEMTLMVLQDLGHQRAGECVLESLFGTHMRTGVRQNLVDDLQDDEAWQDFSNISQQREIFTAVVLMYQAFPNRYPQPDARRLGFTVRDPTAAPGARSNTMLLQFLSAGMMDTDVLLRLYADDLKKRVFPEADSIVWHREDKDAGEHIVVSSRQWLGSLARGMTFNARVA